MDSQNPKTTFFHGDGNGAEWKYSESDFQGFTFSSRSPPVPIDLPDDHLVMGITYYKKDPCTKKVTSRIDDTQYSVTGSLSSIDATLADAASRELREEIGVVCVSPSGLGTAYTETVGWQTYTTFIVSAKSLRPIVESEAIKSDLPGKDDKKQKVQVFVHGSKTELAKLLSLVKFRVKTASEDDIAGVTIIPVQMVRNRYRNSLGQSSEGSRSGYRGGYRDSSRGSSRGGYGGYGDGYRDGYRNGYRDGYRDSYRDGYHDGNGGGYRCN
jgi:hypothetical protein